MAGWAITSFFTDPNKSVIKKLVMAQPAISINQAIDTLREWKGIRKTPKLKLSNWLIETLIYKKT